MAFTFNTPPATAGQAPATQPAPTTPPTSSHPLPPPGTMPPQQPPAQQTAPPAPARRASARRGATKTAAATPPLPTQQPAPQLQPQPQPAPQQQVATQPPPAASSDPFDGSYVPPEANRAPITLPPGGLLGVIAAQAPATDKPSALKSISEIGDRKGGEPNIFPTVYLAGGQTGGGMVKDDMNVEGTDDTLPVGNEGFHGVVFGFRFISLLWPVAQNPQLKSRPFSRAVLGSLHPELATIAFEAQRKYQFRNRPPVKYGAEPFYDQQAGGQGHPSLTIEMLVYDAEAGLTAVQSCSTYDSVLDTSRNMNAAFPDGKIQPTPVCIKPHTWQTKGSKAQPNGWPEHGYHVTIALDAYGEEAWNAWTAFLASPAGADVGLAEDLMRWGTTDIAPKHQASLQTIMNA